MSVREASILPKFKQPPLTYEVQCLLLRIILENVAGWEPKVIFPLFVSAHTSQKIYCLSLPFPLMRMSQNMKHSCVGRIFLHIVLRAFLYVVSTLCSCFILFCFALFGRIRNTFKKIFFNKKFLLVFLFFNFLS